jgi:membrane peptidoglycan carboxypeptidase
MRERSLMSNATSLLICGLLAGVVVAAAAFPAVAFTGLTAKQGSDSFQSLPSNLQIPQQPQISYLYANDGKTLIAQIYDENRKDVSLTDVAPTMRQAIVAAEDTRFYHHHGVDLKGVVRALVANGTSGEVEQGSSTLTMQYVRNVLKTNPNLTPEERAEATQDTTARKLTEMRYAVALEKKLTKAQILDRYLNITYFGDGAYGIYAASETYFSKPPSKLTVNEAATIAGIVQTPDQDPTKDMKYATERRNYVLGSMVKMGDITKARARAERAKPIKLNLSSTPNGCISVPSNHPDWGFYCDYVEQWWQQQKAFGDTPAERLYNLKTGGYKIITSMDPQVQRTATKQSQILYGKTDPKIMPIAAIEPGTGHVLALSVNRNYSLDSNSCGKSCKRPNTVDPLITGSFADKAGYRSDYPGYQTGSTFKMFTMLAALSQLNSDGSHKYPLDTGYNAPVQYATDYPIDPSSPAACTGANGGSVYCVKNDSDSNYFVGYRNMWTGFAHSVNTYFVWLEQQVGPQNAVNMAKKLGITFYGNPNQSDPATDAWLSNNASQWGAFTLGVVATYPLTLANAYATIAADGKYCSPDPVNRIVGPNGNTLGAGQPDCHQAIDPDIARAATDATRCTVNQSPYYGSCNTEGGTNGTAYGVAGELGDWQFGGKTGSSQDNATESFVGITTKVAAASTAVDPNDPSDWVGSGASYYVDEAVTQTMKTALEGKKQVDFKKESEAIAYGSKGYLQSAPETSSSPSPSPSDSNRGPWDNHGGFSPPVRKPSPPGRGQNQ